MNPVSWLFIAAIRLYQWFIAPLLGPACRFMPSCSEYAREAIEIHGPLAGTWLAVRRLLRCHPWGGEGWDPVPPAERCTIHAHRRCGHNS
ncbi:MAG TPA: membrane protein insertion efficiency factor YidD [Alphaproteobacteria bacterium]